MILTCPCCGKRYKLSECSSTSTPKTLQCPDCGGQIPLGQKPSVEPKTHGGIVEIQCSACRKSYRIPATKIPFGKTRARCKACGHSIDLRPFLNADSTKPQASAKALSSNPLPENEPVKTPKANSKPSGRPRRLAVWGAGVGLLLIGAVLICYFWPRFFPPTVKVAPTMDLPDALNPVAGLSINVSRLIDLLERPGQKTDKEKEFSTQIARLKTLSIDTVEAAIFPDAEHVALAAVVLRGGHGIIIEQLLTDENALAPYVEKIAKRRYRFKKDALPPEAWGDFPVDLYELRLIDSDCFIAPGPLFSQMPPGHDLIAHTPMARFSDAVEDKGNAAVLTIRFPEDFSAGWEEKLARHPAINDVPKAKLLANLGATLIRQFTEPFKQLEFFALGLRIDDDDQRQLQYAQQFWPAIDGAAVYEKLQSRQTDIAPGVVNSMVRLLSDPRLQTDMEFNKNRLRLKIGWHQRNDEPILKALSEATLGQLFAGTMINGGEPTSGPVKTTYRETPALTLDIDPDAFKKELPHRIETALFPDHFWQSNDDPNMTLELDPVIIPNAELANVDYEILSVQSLDGRNILRQTDAPFKSPLNLAGRYSARIRLDVAKGARPEDLGTARLKFKVSMPTKLALFEFKAGSSQQRKTAGPIQAMAESIEKDIARVSTRGGDGFWVFAYDKTGRAISSAESMGSENSKFVRFGGIIHKLQVVVAANTLEHTFEIDADLNQGRKIELTHKPQVPPRTRLDYSPMEKYAVFSRQDLSGLQVKWFEDDANAWSQPGLKVKLPKGPFSGQTFWDAHFFGRNKAIPIKGTPFSSGDEVGFWVDREKLKTAHAVFGKVRIKAAEKIETMRFNLKKGESAVSRSFATGEKIRLSFRQNEITYQPGRANVIRVRAYDAQNRRLKMDNYSSSGKGRHTRYFWGIPVKVEMDAVLSHLERTIDFDLRQRPIDKKAYGAFKKEVAQRKKIVAALKKVYQVRRKAFKQYGEDLAGFYFLRGTASEPALEKAVALSDPKGEARFGYRAQPFNGYYFTVLPKSQKMLDTLEKTRQKKGRPYTFKGKTITALPVRSFPDLAAIPKDKAKPAFFLRWGRVYMNHLNGQALAHVPDNHYNSDWKEVKFVEP